jgi:site-specific DNA-methyltransferase (adenine-specific)
MLESQYKLHLGNTKNILDDMISKNEKVDMIFTSPPYFAFRKNYSGQDDGEIGSIHVDDYADWFLEFTKRFLNVLKPNGSFFLNINEKIDKGVIHPVLDELKYKMRQQGWYLVAKPYIWFKKNSMPTNCKYRAIDRYEYVYHFSNSTKPKFRADNCRTEHSEVTKRRFKKPVTTINSRDGIYNSEMKELSKKGSLPHNVVIAASETNPGILHPAPFSVDLAEWFVKVGSDIGDTVLDPFAGSSTTGVASLKNGRNFIGIDLVEFNINFGKKRIEHLLSTGDCYIPKNKLEEYGIDVNYYKIKGKHINNP